MSGPGPYGPGRRGEPHDGPGGGREVAYGPDVSWPDGFRPMDTGARRLLEAGYGTAGYGRGHAGWGNGAGYGSSGRGTGPAYRQPAVDDFGYGDPGYSDPAYDGPRSGYGGPSRAVQARGPGGWPAADGPGYGGVPGYRGPGFGEPARADRAYQQGSAPAGKGGIYPVTGAQETLPATGPQPAAASRPGRDAGVPQAARPGYPGQWYGQPRRSDPRDTGSRSSDPRLGGMHYDELRYSEPAGSGYDQPLDDESWYQELRRSSPDYPQQPDGQPAPGQRRGDLRAAGYGQQPGTGPGGAGLPGGMGQQGGCPQGSGYGQGRDGPGPRGPGMSAASQAGTAALPQDLARQGDGYLSAPTTQVGLLAPPAVGAPDDPPDDLSLLAAPGAGEVLAPPVRPGHGLDGPEITSSWPTRPAADDAQSFEEFWAEADHGADYDGLFPGEGHDSGRRRGTRPWARNNGRSIGRRRGRSNDHRLWLALAGVVVVAAAAIIGILKFEFPSNSGPTHILVTPARIGSYVRTPNLERQTKVNQLRDEVVLMSEGQASSVVSAVYESGNSAAGSTEQIVMFIGGHLANSAPATSIASFTQKFPGATVVSAGSLGGKAACVEEASGTSDSVAMCVWFDNDSFGEIVSPTMSASSLAGVMRTMRPSLELVVRK